MIHVPLTTFEEEIYLRALTGRLVGKALADLDLNKVAVVSSKNVICSSIAAATEATSLTLSGGATHHFMVEHGKEKELAGRLREFSAQAILLQFGGETPFEETKGSFIELLKAMAEEGGPGSLVIHVRIFAAGGLEEALPSLELTRLAEYQVTLEHAGLLNRSLKDRRVAFS